MDVTAIIIAASIPSAITGFCFWLIERNIKKQDKRGRPRKKPGARTWRGAKTYGSNKSFTSSKA